MFLTHRSAGDRLAVGRASADRPAANRPPHGARRRVPACSLLVLLCFLLLAPPLVPTARAQNGPNDGGQEQTTTDTTRADTTKPETTNDEKTNAETKDLGDATLEELGNIQVYGASKRLQSTSDAPSSVTVITADEIQKYGYRTLAEILESVRGFYITYDRDYTFVGVRGFGRLGDWNSRILLLIDGHRVNDNVLGMAMIGPEFLVDVDLIERVEIIRGPSSSLYGAQDRKST